MAIVFELRCLRRQRTPRSGRPHPLTWNPVKMPLWPQPRCLPGLRVLPIFRLIPRHWMFNFLILWGVAIFDSGANFAPDGQFVSSIVINFDCFFCTEHDNNGKQKYVSDQESNTTAFLNHNCMYSMSHQLQMDEQRYLPPGSCLLTTCPSPPAVEAHRNQRPAHPVAPQRMYLWGYWHHRSVSTHSALRFAENICFFPCNMTDGSFFCTNNLKIQFWTLMCYLSQRGCSFRRYCGSVFAISKTKCCQSSPKRRNHRSQPRQSPFSTISKKMIKIVVSNTFPFFTRNRLQLFIETIAFFQESPFFSYKNLWSIFIREFHSYFSDSPLSLNFFPWSFFSKSSC